MMNITYAYVVRSHMYAQLCRRPKVAFVVGILG